MDPQHIIYGLTLDSPWIIVGLSWSMHGLHMDTQLRIPGLSIDGQTFWHVPVSL